MITFRKSTLRKIGLGAAILLLPTFLVVIFSPSRISLADGATCGDGVCAASENSDLCSADCDCVDNGVADPNEGCGCKDVVCDSESLKSACGTPAGENGECPSGTATDGTTKSLSEFKGVCWDACECQGLCTKEDEEETKKNGGGVVVVPPACLGQPAKELEALGIWYVATGSGDPCSASCSSSTFGGNALWLGCSHPDYPPDVGEPCDRWQCNP